MVTWVTFKFSSDNNNIFIFPGEIFNVWGPASWFPLLGYGSCLWILSLETRGQREEASYCQSKQVLDMQAEAGAEASSCGFCLERFGCGARHRDPASSKNKSQAWTKAKHLLCAFGSGWPGYLTPGNIFPFTLHCPGASITFLTQSPGMGIASTPKILRAVTHLSFQHPHLPNHAAPSWSYR